MFNYNNSIIKIICLVIFICYLICGLTIGKNYLVLTSDMSEGICEFIGLISFGIAGWIQGVLINCIAEIIEYLDAIHKSLNYLESIHKKLHHIEDNINKNNEITNL